MLAVSGILLSMGAESMRITASWRWDGLRAGIALLLVLAMAHSEPLRYWKVANSEQGGFEIVSSNIGDLNTMILNNTMTGKRTASDC